MGARSRARHTHTVSLSIRYGILHIGFTCSADSVEQLVATAFRNALTQMMCRLPVVSITVKADLPIPIELVELVEKIIIEQR